MSTTGGHLVVQFDPLTDTLTTSKDIPVTYVVWNDVSTVSTDRTIGVVGKAVVCYYYHEL